MRLSAVGVLRLGSALALFALVGWFVFDFPILRFELAIGFLIYAGCLWRWPWLWLVAIPCLLPLLDLASWSGRFFFDEFDAVVLLTAGILAIRESDTETMSPLPRDLRWVLAILTASYIISGLVRLWPPAPITVDSFANYASPYNSIRVAKGFVWALLLLRPLRAAVARFKDAKLLLGIGFLLGLLGVSLVILYERWLFTGMLTWVTTYRTTASFSSMHTGDGPIDVWLSLSIPFLGLLLIDRRWLRLLPYTAALVLLSIYCLIAAESRGAVVATAIACLVGLLALLAIRGHKHRAGGMLAISIGVVVVISIVALPFVASTSIGQRFSMARADASVRLHYWRYDLSLRDDTASAQLFGMGLGSFPAVHQERSVREPKATRYHYVSDGGEHFLNMKNDLLLYMEQIVPATQNSDYQFHARLRTAEPHASLTVMWCEKWMLTSANCTTDVFNLRSLPNQWQDVSTAIHTAEVGSGRHVAGLFFERPTKLTFFIADAPTTGVDVGQISLRDDGGHELIANGDFAQGADHWFWSEDGHWQWHTANLAVNILFDQGWFGLFAVVLLLLVTLARLASQIGRDDPLSAIYLAAIIGFVVTGVTVSTFDQPRLALTFYLLCFAVLVRDPWSGEQSQIPAAI